MSPQNGRRGNCANYTELIQLLGTESHACTIYDYLGTRSSNLVGVETNKPSSLVFYFSNSARAGCAASAHVNNNIWFCAILSAAFVPTYTTFLQFPSFSILWAHLYITPSSMLSPFV